MAYTSLDGAIEIYQKGKTTIEQEQQSQDNNNEEYSEEEKRIKSIDFTLKDQYENVHTLSEYEGKTVFLNFWATWCPPCKAEMPYIEEIYKEYGLNKDDVVILGVASPNSGKEGSEEHIKNFLKEEKYTFPVVMDKNGEFIYKYISLSGSSDSKNNN
jgi:cytochrome c-type biogenesis protein